MENNDLAEKRNKRAVLLVRIATLFGFSIIMFAPTTYRNPFNLYLMLGYAIFLPVGLLAAYVLGLITRFILKSFIRNKRTYIILLIILMMIGFGAGFLSLMYTFRALSGTL